MHPQISAISAVESSTGIAPDAKVASSLKNSSEVGSGLDWISRQVHVADAQISAADQSVRRLAVGEDVELHRVMLDIEKARVSFDLVVQVRNRLLDAYQEVLRMQI